MYVDRPTDRLEQFSVTFHPWIVYAGYLSNKIVNGIQVFLIHHSEIIMYVREIHGFTETLHSDRYRSTNEKQIIFYELSQVFLSNQIIVTKAANSNKHIIIILKFRQN